MSRLFAALAAVLLLASARAAEKPDAPIAATPAMWVVHGPQGTVYLLGSMHRLPKGTHWQTPAITAAMSKAGAFVFEIPLDADSMERTALTMRDNAIFPFTTSLATHFDDATREDFRRVIWRTHANPEIAMHMRPWLAALYLQGATQGDLGREMEDGVDDQVYAWARHHRIRSFGALETVDDQVVAVKGGRRFEDEMVLFRLMLKTILTTKPHPAKALFEAWAKGDVKALAALGPEDATMPVQLKKPLLEDRNRRWIPEIEAMLRTPRTTFVTVGAAHLVGRTGVPNLLRAKGYVVEGPDVQPPTPAALPSLRLTQAG